MGGVILNSAFAASEIVGGAWATSKDTIRDEFIPEVTGLYDISFSGRITGEVYAVAGTVSIPVGAGLSLPGQTGEGFIARVDVGVFEGGSPVPGTLGQDPLIATELPSTLDVLGNQVWGLVKSSIDLGTIGDVIEVVQSASHLLPVAEWDRPLNWWPGLLCGYLEQGVSYSWQVSAVSHVKSATVAIGGHIAWTDIQVEVEDVTISLKEGSEPSNPFIGSLTASPDTVVDGSHIVLVAEGVIDPDGGPISQVDFYRDLNGNAQLDVNTDQYLGSDSTVTNDEAVLLRVADFGPGLHRYFAQALDDEGSIGQPAVTVQLVQSAPPQPGNDLEFYGTHWQDPDGDDDEIMEAEESVRTKVILRSNSAVSHVDAVLSTADSQIIITDSHVNYEDFTAGESHEPIGWLDMDLNFDLSEPQSRVSDFALTLTYQKDGKPYYQTIAFQKEFLWEDDWGSFEVIDYTLDDSPSIRPQNNGDGVFQSGEEVHILPRIRNNGITTATSVNVTLLYDGDGLEVDPNARRYPDLSPGQVGIPQNGRSFWIEGGPSFSGIARIDVQIEYDEATSPVVIPDAISLQINPAPWIQLNYGQWNFGMIGTSENAAIPLEILNRGTSDLHVSDIEVYEVDPDTGAKTLTPVYPDPGGDTGYTPADLPWTIAPGAAKPIEMIVYGPAVQQPGKIVREVVVTSDGRLVDPTPASVRIVITGLISDVPPAYQIPGITGADRPDASGSVIVYQAGGDIFAYDLESSNVQSVFEGPGNQSLPRISGNIVAFNDDSGSGDVYARSWLGGELIDVAVVSDEEEKLVGVGASQDGTKVAYLKKDYSFVEPNSTGGSVWNLYLFDVTTGTEEPITTFGYSGHDPIPTVSFGDFGGNVLTWKRRTFIWDGSQWSNSGPVSLWKLDLDADAQPIEISDDPPTSSKKLASNEGRVAWSEKDSQSDPQIYVWPDDVNPPVTSGPDNYGRNGLALGNNVVVYAVDPELSRPSRVDYTELDTGNQGGVATSFDDARYMRMDGHLLTWPSAGGIYYSYLKEPDLSVSSADITFSDDRPVEGDVIDVTVTVYNVNLWDFTDNAIVRLYDGNPDAGGEQWGPDMVIEGGIVARGQASGTSSDLPVPLGWEGAREIYARVFVPGSENLANNAASRILEVQDSDLEGPAISEVTVSEQDGDGDGIIGADEQIRVVWSLSDPGGVGSTELWVDIDGDGLGDPGSRDPDDAVPLAGDYYATLGPLDAGEFRYAIDTTDADTSPASSVYSGSFEVVLAEEITVLRDDGTPLQDGQATPIEFGSVVQGVSPASILFRVLNDGEQNLHLGTIEWPAGFDVNWSGPSVLDPGDSAWVAVTLLTDAVGEFEGPIILTNSDGPRSPDGLDENPFDFPVHGEVHVNEPPTVELTNTVPTLAEDTDITSRVRVADVEVTDDALGTNTLSLSGADAYLFEVEPVGGTGGFDATLYLKAGAALDFATNPGLDVAVEVDDATVGGTPDDTAAMAIDVTDVNEPPTVALANPTTALAENTDMTNRRKVADIVITDDALGTNDLSLSGADAVMFEINGTELYLSAGATLDFETNPVLDVTLKVDDITVGGTPDHSAALAINITDVNEGPMDILLSSATVAEKTDTSSGHAVGVLSGTDPDISAPFNTLSFAVQGGADSAKFSVDGSNQLVLTDGLLDFKNPTDANEDGIYEVTVRVTDGGTPGLTYDEALMVTVTDVNELPTAALTGTVYIDANRNHAPDPFEHLPGVIITLTGTTPHGTFQSTAITQNDGSYRFENLWSGTYEITEGQPRACVDGGEHVISSVHLPPGDTSTDHDFPELALRPEFISIEFLWAANLSPERYADLLRRIIANAEEAAGETEVAEWIRTGQVPTPVNMYSPTEPSGIALTDVSTDRATFRWDASIDGDGNAVIYEIQYRDQTISSDWQPITPLTTDSTSLDIATLQEETAYDVRLRAVDGQGGQSDWVVREGLFTTLRPNMAPTEPADLGTSNVAVDAATLTGDPTTDVDNDRVTYEIEYTERGSLPISRTATPQTTTGTSTVITCLDPNTTYDVRPAHSGMATTDNQTLTQIGPLPGVSLTDSRSAEYATAEMLGEGSSEVTADAQAAMHFLPEDVAPEAATLPEPSALRIAGEILAKVPQPLPSQEGAVVAGEADEPDGLESNPIAAQTVTEPISEPVALPAPADYSLDTSKTAAIEGSADGEPFDIGQPRSALTQPKPEALAPLDLQVALSATEVLDNGYQFMPPEREPLAFADMSNSDLAASVLLESRQVVGPVVLPVTLPTQRDPSVDSIESVGESLPPMISPNAFESIFESFGAVPADYLFSLVGSFGQWGRFVPSDNNEKDVEETIDFLLATEDPWMIVGARP